MRKILIYSIPLLSLIINSCQFNQSVNKDVTTGAYSRGDGIGCDDIIIEINGNKENRNTFFYGEKVKFSFKNISGLKKENNKVYPGLSMYILKNKKDTIFSRFNLLTDLKEGTDLSILDLQANFRSNLPYESNESYSAIIKIWDRKGKGTFMYELPFKVQKNEFLDIKSNNLKYSEIYLWNENDKYAIANKNIKLESTLILILDKIEGMETIDNKVYPIFSLEITDSKGNKILSNPNVLVEYENNGVDYNKLKDGQLSATIKFAPGVINNPCKLKSSIIDKKSDRRIDIEAELEIN